MRGGVSTTKTSIKRIANKRLASSICNVYACNVEFSQNSKYGEVEIGTAVATALAAYKGYQRGSGNNMSMEDII